MGISWGSKTASGKKRKSIAAQILMRSSLILAVTGLLTVSLTFTTMRVEIDKHIETDVTTVKDIVAGAIEASREAGRLVDHQNDLYLQQASRSIARDLSGRSAASISNEELERLKKEWGLYGLSLFERKGDDIVVSKSTDGEVGLSSRGWGYWFTAFNQLMNREPVTVGYGFADRNYWVGPVSKSAWNTSYFKYAYYYDGTTPFMINAYIIDRDTQLRTYETNISDMIGSLIQEKNIKEAAVVNIEPFLQHYDESKIIDPLRDSPVLFGKLTTELPEDEEMYRRVLAGEGEQRQLFEQDGMKFWKFYMPLPDKRAMTITVDLYSQSKLEERFIWILAVSYVVAFATIYFVVRTVSRQKLKPLFEMEVFLRRVAKGDLSGRLEVRENNELGSLGEQINDMTEQLDELMQESNRRAKEKMMQLVNHDELTGLPNRKRFRERLQQEIATGEKEPAGTMFGVLFLDLDRFKTINESQGHGAGDRLLKEVGAVLRALMPEDHLLARLGADEFALLVPAGQSADDISQRAQEVLQRFASPLSVDGTDHHVTLSIGISTWPQDGQDAETLLKNADTAMDSAKQRGGFNFQFYQPAMNEMILEQLRMENRLRQALEQNELIVYYQPLVCIATGEVQGMEALLRWNNPQEGMISPARFIPVAEKTGLILPIGEWVLRTACRETQRWHEAGYHDLHVSVNLSPRQFEHPDLVDMIAGILLETSLRPECLKLEITESVAMQNADRAIEKLHALKELGIHISIDDFGTGYSSLNYLKRFPIDTLKIDRSFVGDIPRDGDDMAIVTAIIAMAHNLKIDVVAEGVETSEQLQFLQAQDCDLMQGYLFSPPVPAPVFDELLAEGRVLPVPTPIGSPKTTY